MIITPFPLMTQGRDLAQEIPNSNKKSQADEATEHEISQV